MIGLGFAEGHIVAWVPYSMGNIDQFVHTANLASSPGHQGKAPALTIRFQRWLALKSPETRPQCLPRLAQFATGSNDHRHDYELVSMTTEVCDDAFASDKSFGIERIL